MLDDRLAAYTVFQQAACLCEVVCLDPSSTERGA